MSAEADTQKKLEEKKANLRSSLERIRLAESFPVKNGDFVEKSSSGWLSSRKVSTVLNKSN